MMEQPLLIKPKWPAPARVCALQTTRIGGMSEGVYKGFNLSNQVGDKADSVLKNRQMLSTLVGIEPIWLKQIHGTYVLNIDKDNQMVQRDRDTGFFVADAAISRGIDHACCVMSADCLPVLFCNQAGSVVAAAHAGWKGLLDGVLEKTLEEIMIDTPASQILVWLGPAIGPSAFEVGEEVRTAFLTHPVCKDANVRAKTEAAFDTALIPGKWFADLHMLAKIRLQAKGIHRESIFRETGCTFSDEKRFFSYRRDGHATGRMATLIWLDV